MNILVTGSRGFVGKRLVAALREKGHRVREFDIELGNDILRPEQCERAIRGIEVVYHLAAVLNERSRLLLPVNVKGTENMLLAAAKKKCRQFIYLGTAGVHAGQSGKVNEGSPFAPVTPYEESKAKAEQVVEEFQEMLPITVLRSALVLGPNNYWRGIVDYIRQGKPLVGKGEQVWQTIFIDDLVDALLFVLGKEECLGEVFIVAEGEKHSLLALYLEIRKQLGLEGKVKTVPVWMAKLKAKFSGKGIAISEHIERLVRERNYSTRKINKLGWKAKIGMKEAVERTVAGLRGYN